MGPGPRDAKVGRVPNMILWWCDKSIEYECDQRQVEELVAEWRLDGSTAVATPGLEDTSNELGGDDTNLPDQLKAALEGAAARGNYLASDRLDVQLACKQVCRWVSRPDIHACKALKWICRYLVRSQRSVWSTAFLM